MSLSSPSCATTSLNFILLPLALRRRLLHATRGWRKRSSISSTRIYMPLCGTSLLPVWKHLTAESAKFWTNSIQNNRGAAQSRRDLFIRLDQHLLMPLPPRPFYLKNANGSPFSVTMPSCYRITGITTTFPINM